MPPPTLCTAEPALPEPMIQILLRLAQTVPGTEQAEAMEMKLLCTERIGGYRPRETGKRLPGKQAEWKREVGAGLTDHLRASKGSGRKVRTKRTQQF